MFKVYLMKKDFTPINISSINREIDEININNIGVTSVDNLNFSISKFIKNDEGGLTDIEEWFSSEDIKCVCYHILRWRRCTAYMFIQFSNKGIRHLCYFSDEVKHNGQSFGTSMENVDKNQVYQCMEENLKRFVDESKTLDMFLKKEKEDLQKNIDNYKNNFGI